MAEIESLQARWNYLYREHLPALAQAKDDVQSHWPVHLDHCFARIVLDNSVGIDRPWTEVVKQPAVKYMTVEQLENVIDLAERIATGQADLVELNDQSLDFRGKKRKAASDAEQNRTTKKQRSSGTVSSYFPPASDASKQDSDRMHDNTTETKSSNDTASKDKSPDVDMAIQLKRITNSNLTPFRKQMLTLLCQIPRGRYSTYKAMSDHITQTSHKTCARAVGNAMRNNPFAPEVPCHRVLANDGSLGGFCGDWGEGGRFASEKRRLLFEEGVRFDSRGRVKGPIFRFENM